MRFIKAAIVGMFLGTLVSCALMPFWGERLTPHYTEVDPKAAPIVNEWLSLAAMRGLKFSQTVNVGFMDIGKGNVIGQCNYGLNFNEIDLHTIYWEYMSNNLTKTALLFHELSHCYCNRLHDYDEGKEYDDNEDSKTNLDKKEGFFEDHCPISLMFPFIVDNQCFLTHYAFYTSEMFDRCDPI